MFKEIKLSPKYLYFVPLYSQKYFKCVHLSPIVTTTVLVQQKCGNPISDNAKQYRQWRFHNYCSRKSNLFPHIYLFYLNICQKYFKCVHLSPSVTTTVLVQQKCRNPILYNRQIMCTFVVSLTVKDLQILISAKYRIKNNEYIFIIRAGLIYNWRKFN